MIAKKLKKYQILTFTFIFLISFLLISSNFLKAEVKLDHQGNVEISDEKARVGDKVTISGEIKNVGNEKSNVLIFNIELFWDYDKDGFPDKEESYFIEKNYTEYVEIEPNETYTYEFNWIAGKTEEPKKEELTGNFLILVDIGYVEKEENDTKIENNETGISQPFTILEKEKGLCMMSWVAVIPIFGIVYKYKNLLFF